LYESGDGLASFYGDFAARYGRGLLKYLLFLHTNDLFMETFQWALLRLKS
jgi:hypothetical protein